MSGSPKSKKLSANLDLGVRAEARLEVKAEVPSASVGRFVDALTDLFRPYSEAQGLRADLIRLQREEVAVRIARLAREKVEAEGRQLVPPPLKLLIPLFEKGSQEELEDEFMIELWADLLVSASSETSVPPRFVSIVGELNGRQARLFLEIATKKIQNVTLPHLYPENSAFEFQVPNFEQKVKKVLGKKGRSLAYIFDNVCQMFERPGVAMVDIIVADYSVPTSENKYGTNECQSDLQVLASLSLLQFVYFRRELIRPRGENVSVYYYYITDMGCDFYRAVSGK